MHRCAILVITGAYVALQLLVPLRHFLYPGDVSWTEEGHCFAWHMKLRDKTADALFVVTDPVTLRSWTVRPEHFLPRWQARKMATRPDMILQFSAHLADQARRAGLGRVEVRARVLASLNGRRHRLLVDPAVDLAAQQRSLRPARWITRPSLSASSGG